jgi:hypothetical protein
LHKHDEGHIMGIMELKEQEFASLLGFDSYDSYLNCVAGSLKQAAVRMRARVVTKP